MGVNYKIFQKLITFDWKYRNIVINFYEKKFLTLFNPSKTIFTESFYKLDCFIRVNFFHHFIKMAQLTKKNEKNDFKKDFHDWLHILHCTASSIILLITTDFWTNAAWEQCRSGHSRCAVCTAWHSLRSLWAVNYNHSTKSETEKMNPVKFELA